jgi:hypothetical protein
VWCEEERECWDGGAGDLKDDGGASIIFGPLVRWLAFDVVLGAREPLPKGVE